MSDRMDESERRKRPPRCPALYQLNTRVRLTELSQALGHAATLDDIGDAELDRWAALGFDWIWLLGVWQTGPAGVRIARSLTEWRREFEHALPDLRDEDIGGSGFAVRAYQVHAALGGDAALARLRERLRARGLKLMLDFVPNHVALDHPWVEQHPDFFVQGSAAELAHAPQNWTRLRTSAGGMRVLAHGRDPYFDGWPDTLQLNYGKAQLQQAMTEELQRIATQCDGVRCDMAMLLLPEVFERTWGIRIQPFWPKALAAVRHRQPGFEFMAEVYWDLEWTLQRQGFDHTYDKRLCDRLREQQAVPVREHLCAGLDYQQRMARFLENHDEPRAAAVFAPEVHAAAALVCHATPGLRLFHQGQLEGRRVRIPPHLVRAPDEPVDARLAAFYARLLAVLRHAALRDGEWGLLDTRPAWDGNASAQQFIAWQWQGPGEAWLCAAVNYAAVPGQCFVPLQHPGIAGRTLRFADLLGDAVYDRPGDDVLQRGLFLDLPPWGHHLFEVSLLP
jgi:Alpha amylase, catalytic domain